MKKHSLGKLKVFYPGEQWNEEPQELFKSFNPYDSVFTYILNDMNTTGLMVIQNGKLIFQYGDVAELSYIASCRKSLLAMLYGKYVDNGTIDLSRTLEDIGIDDVQGLLPNEKKATIKHLITARSGVYHPASNAGDHSSEAPQRGSQDPGDYYLYNNWDFNAAGTIFEKLTGKNIYEAFEQDIAIPIQMQDYSLDKQNKYGNTKNSYHQAYHFTLSTRDMARLGYLMLRKGMWNDNQIIPRSWIDEMLQVSTKLEDMNPPSEKNGVFSYGYMWWLFDANKCGKIYKNAFTARGHYGQFISVIPSLDIVVAHKTKAIYLRTTDNYFQMLDMLVKNLKNFKMIEVKEKRKILNYTGTYTKSNNGESITISSESASLFYESGKRRLTRLLPYKKNTYVTIDDLTKVVFKKNSCGVFDEMFVGTRKNKVKYYKE